MSFFCPVSHTALLPRGEQPSEFSHMFLPAPVLSFMNPPALASLPSQPCFWVGSFEQAGRGAGLWLHLQTESWPTPHSGQSPEHFE